MLRGRTLCNAAGAGTALVALLAPLLVASPAVAGTFAADGTFEFDPTAVASFDFEESEDPDGGLSVKADDASLSGAHVLALAPFQGADLAVTLPAERRTYRVSAWIRDNETVGSFVVSYSDRSDEVSALYPTGRVTSDGWVEIANHHLRVDGKRLKSATVGLFAANGGVADGVEVVPDGGEDELPSPPNAKCGGVTDPGACGEGQLCVWSECRNVNGWVPPIPEDRDAVAAYLRARIELFFGPYLERTQDLPAAQVALDQMTLAKDPWTYWNGFTTAVRRLHDGHTTTNGLADFVLSNPRPFSFCFIEGDADLSHGLAPKDPDYLDVLVSHTGADHNLGLRAGDRLVSVDGQHPIAWARGLVGVNWSQPGISNHTTFAELASSLRGMISRYAKEIQVIRCDAGSSFCTPVETISIDDVPFDPPGTMIDSRACDNRPIRHLAGAPVDHATGDTVHAGVVLESAPGEDIYGLEWESLYTTNGNDGVGAALNNAVSSWKTGARGVILDHRTGFGGTILAPEILWTFAQKRRPLDYYVDRTFSGEEQPTLAEGKAIFDASVQSNQVQYAGSSSPHTEIPVALLITEDVSASDWLPLGLKGAPHAKIFGPFQTNGGFSTRYSFGYWLSLGYVVAVGDDIQPDGSTHNGMGVEPDVVVLPKQSDLLVGKDSVYEAALSWVRSELKP